MFHIADSKTIKKGLVTDVYFTRVKQVIQTAKADKQVVAEIRVSRLPDGWDWAVFAGLEEALQLLAGLNVNVKALPEGTIFYPEEPVLTVSGLYTEFALFETALLGLLCQASGVATKAARCKLAAGGKAVYSFGARRMHPVISPMIERNAFIGGCDGVAVVASAQLIGQPAVGTMSHSLILTVGDDAKAFALFHQLMPPEVKRIALIDTFKDEKFGALTAAETLGTNLYAVRLDTPRSRRGNFRQIINEVRWELNLRGYQSVKIFVSGGLDEQSIKEVADIVDAFGVGTAISNAPVVDFSLDIVAVEGKPLAKRGKLSGDKQILLCQNCGQREIVPSGQRNCSFCAQEATPLLVNYLTNGLLTVELPQAVKIRNKLLRQLKELTSEKLPQLK